MAPLLRYGIFLAYFITQLLLLPYDCSEMQYQEHIRKDPVKLDITDTDLDEAFEHGEKKQEERRTMENELCKKGSCLDPRTKTAGGRHQLFPDGRDYIVEGERIQIIFDEASKYLIEKKKMNSQDAIHQLSRVSFAKSTKASSIQEKCQSRRQMACHVNSRYRSLDGTCNNREQTFWGSANSCLQRMHPPEFADFQSSPRKSKSGEDLPNARNVSNIIHAENSRAAYTTHMFMQWGQFLSHDLVFTPTTQLENGQMLQCCPNGDHPECFPITIADNDEFYSAYKKTCLNFVRSATCPTCTLGPRQFLNQPTSFIDLSQLYGSSEETARQLRSFKRGALRVSYDYEERELPPRSINFTTDQCSLPDENMYCFQTGDPRANQHPGLLSLYVLFLREHNRIADNLFDLNPEWDDERLYQETRRILGAIAQVITYKEFLPILLGKSNMEMYHLKMTDQGYTEYEPTVDPSILAEFSTAAFRSGHSMINHFYEIFESGRSREMKLHDHFFWPFGMYNGQAEHVLRGLIGKPSQEVDGYVIDEVRNHLHQVKDKADYGNDLVAFDIQRGRDHGIPGYTKYVELCLGEKISSFEQLDMLMLPDKRMKFSQVYSSVHDIDLFSGGIAETPLDDGMVGRTFGCIIGKQFSNLKYGDRYYVEHGKGIGTFVPEQLATLKTASLANILCRNMEELEMIRPLVMLQDSSSIENEMVSCDQIQDLDFSLWQEIY